MAKRITVVVSQGQSASPQKRQLEEDIVANLLGERGLEVTVIPHLYDLAPESTGMLCLSGIGGDMIVLSWLFPRAAHWTLDRSGVRGQFGATLLKADDQDFADDEDDPAEAEAESAAAADGSQRVGPRNLPPRTIYHLDLRTPPRLACISTRSGGSLARRLSRPSICSAGTAVRQPNRRHRRIPCRPQQPPR